MTPNMFKAFLQLLFPDVCVACKEPLVAQEKHLLQDGDLVVLTAGTLHGVSGSTDLIKVDVVTAVSELSPAPTVELMGRRLL